MINAVKLGSLVLFGMIGASSAGATSFLVTVEAAGVQNSTSSFTTRGIETFEGRSVTGWNATTGFASTFGNSGITGTYSGVSTSLADQYGAAGGTGEYALARNNGTAASYTLSNLASTGAQGINYFGLWLSALDSGNALTFYKGSTAVFSFGAAQVAAAINALPNASAYYGNPNASFQGQNSAQLYAFLNFYDTSGTFDRVVFSESAVNSGFESDNHTLGNYSSVTGSTVAPVPEPASWMMMIGGFGVIGAMLRRRRHSAVPA